jgi:hypothetical protein
MAYEKVMLPRGLEVAIQTDPATPNVYTDLGVTYSDGSIEYSSDRTEWTGSAAQPIITYYSNMQISAAFDLVQLKLENIHKLMSGVSNLVVDEASPVSVTDEDLAAGSWALETFIPFANQNGAGTVPTSITVANDGALTLDTDYLVVKSGTLWGVIILDTASTDITETLELNYTYTPAASKKLTVGSSSVSVTPRALRIRQNQGTIVSPKYLEFILYSTTMESGLSLTFNRFDSDTPQLIPITMTGRADFSRDDKDQLFSFTDYTD